LLTEEAVRSAVHRALMEVNESLPEGRRIPITGETNVLSMLDSLGTLNLVLRIERQLADSTGTDWDLTGSDVYERTLFASPSLDELVAGVFTALQPSR
jgi:hypothetical protein